MRQITVILLLLACICAWAQNRNDDALVTDLETDMSVPEVPERQIGAIRQHMHAIHDALHRLKFHSSLERSKEVVKVVIPCSELFMPNDTEIKTTAKQKLANFGKFLQYPTMYKIVVAVYTDNTGDEEYQGLITQARAEAIISYFEQIGMEHGHSDLNVSHYGMGNSYEVEPNSTIENRAVNRRVEIYILPEWQMIETARLGKLN